MREEINGIKCEGTAENNDVWVTITMPYGSHPHDCIQIRNIDEFLDLEYIIKKIRLNFTGGMDYK